MKDILTLFNLRPLEIKVWENLFYGGQMGASALAKKSGISRTSVYDILDELVALGLVIESQQLGIKMFAVQPPAKIRLLVEEKEKGIASAMKSLDQLAAIYKSGQVSAKPRMQLFEGRAALQQMMKDMLLYRDITVRACWPIRKIIRLLGLNFLKKFHRERVARNIDIKVIWPARQIPDFKKFPFLKPKNALKRKIRLAPPGTDFSLGYAIYGNTVRYISSSKENFGFLVESPEMAQMMRQQWRLVWKQSKTFK